MPHLRIELHDLSKRYGRVTALDGLSLRISGGEIFGLIGRNGAGKSTAFRAVMGLSYCDSGVVNIEGVDTRSPQAQAIRLTMGYVPQHSVLYDHLTGREFLRFLAELYEVGAGALGSIAKVLDALEMTDAADRYMRSYSLGMRKRISIAASILHEPNYLIMDEPTASLDPASARVVEAEMRRFKSLDRLVLFSSHDMDLVERLSDRVGILNGGKLAFEGRLQELRKRHATHPDEPLDTLFLRVAAKGAKETANLESSGLPRSVLGGIG